MIDDHHINPVQQHGFWQRLLARIEKFIREIGTALPRRVDGEESVAFSIALIALCAKLAKADGQVTRDEVIVFRSIVDIPPEEEANAARVFNLCRQDVRGFESYARQIDALLGEGAQAERRRFDVMDALFHIAMADGVFHEGEAQFLEEVARIFALSEADMLRLKARHIPESWNPWTVLGLDEDSTLEDARRSWRKRIKANHPDLLIADGASQERIALAGARLNDLNKAYEEISQALKKH